MEAELVDREGDRFEVKLPVPRLEGVASAKVAISLWLHLSDDDFKGNFDLARCLDETKLKVEQLVARLNIPKSICDLVNGFVGQIQDGIRDFIRYSGSKCFSKNRLQEILPSLMRRFVWKRVGRIDHLRSAINVLECELKYVEKFVIMCNFCLENKLNEISLDLMDDSFVDSVKFRDSPLVYYWIWCLKGDPSRVPVVGEVSLEFFMIVTCLGLNWWAFVYFWERLVDEEQITIAKRLLQFGPPNAVAHMVLAKLRMPQKLRIFDEMPIDLMSIFWLNSKQYDNALFVWIQTRDKISGEQFATLMKRILRAYVRESGIHPPLRDLWNAAYDHQKSYWFEYEKLKIFSTYFTPSRMPLSRDLSFFCTMMADLPLQRRKEWIDGYTGQLVVNNHYVEVGQVLKLCFPTDKEMAEFKKIILYYNKVTEYCRELFAKNEFDYLRNFTKFYSIDEAARIRFVKYALLPQLVEKFSSPPSKWSQLDKWIEYVLADDAARATQLRKKVVLFMAEKSSSLGWSIDGAELQIFKELVAQFLDEREMIKAKHLVLDEFYKKYKDQEMWGGNECDVCFEKLAKWCLNDEEEVVRFKARFKRYRTT